MSEDPKTPVPVFGKWSYWYWLVLLVLGLQIVFYFFLTWAFS